MGGDGCMGRGFLGRAGGLGWGAWGRARFSPPRAPSAWARPAGAQAGKKTLVCIFQRGAVDGLNMIVPHGDPFYYRERPRIAIPRPGTTGGALDLDGHFGLHPALAPLLPLYQSGALAAVHAV